MQYLTIHFKPPTNHPQPFTSALKPRDRRKMTSESDRMPQAPNPVYAAFATVIGEYAGEPKICLLSMSRDPAAMYWITPDAARHIATNLNTLADCLDPPKSEWRADTESNALVARIRDEIGA